MTIKYARTLPAAPHPSASGYSRGGIKITRAWTPFETDERTPAELEAIAADPHLEVVDVRPALADDPTATPEQLRAALRAGVTS